MREDYYEHQAQTHTLLIMRGKLRTVVQCLTDRDKRGVKQPQDARTKSGETVMEVIQAKHTEVRLLLSANLDSYTCVPLKFVPIGII